MPLRGLGRHCLDTYICMNFGLCQDYLSCCVLWFRPGRTGANAFGRGVLSMQGLSHGVVRVDTENSLTSLTLQDCGQVLPGGDLRLHALIVL